eukprot:6555010-Pyramimonas_sp.AAC.1
MLRERSVPGTLEVPPAGLLPFWYNWMLEDKAEEEAMMLVRALAAIAIRAHFTGIWGAVCALAVTGTAEESEL